jgi:hypothetical protein
MRRLEWSVGHPTYRERAFFVRTPDLGLSFEVDGIAQASAIFCVAMLARSGNKANVGCPTEARVTKAVDSV